MQQGTRHTMLHRWRQIINKDQTNIHDLLACKVEGYKPLQPKQSLSLHQLLWWSENLMGKSDIILGNIGGKRPEEEHCWYDQSGNFWLLEGQTISQSAKRSKYFIHQYKTWMPINNCVCHCIFLYQSNSLIPYQIYLIEWLVTSNLILIILISSHQSKTASYATVYNSLLELKFFIGIKYRMTFSNMLAKIIQQKYC